MFRNPTTGLPPHSVRVSNRAKRISLRIVGTSLEVVLPKGIPASVVPDVLVRHAQWIQRHSLVLNQDGCEVEGLMPTNVLFTATGETFHVIASDVTRLRTDGASRCLFIPAEREVAIKGLRAWLVRCARSRLGLMLEEVASATGLRWSSLRIGMQRSRWGSCSWRGGISLNARLLFFAPDLARHVIIHELCHTVEPNHGDGFHALLRHCDGMAEIHARQLRYARHSVPLWAR